MFVIILFQAVIFDTSAAIGRTCVCEAENAVLYLNSSIWAPWAVAKTYCSSRDGFLPINNKCIDYCMKKWVDYDKLNPLKLWKGKLNGMPTSVCPLASMAKYPKKTSTFINTTCTNSHRFACASRKELTAPTTGKPGPTDFTRLRPDTKKTTYTKRNQPLTTKSDTPQNSVPTTSVLLPTNPSKLSKPSANPSAGVIAGAVLGTLFTIGCVCLAVFCLRRKCLAGQHSQDKDSTTNQDGMRRSELVDEYVYGEAAGGSNQARQNPLSDKNSMPRDNVRNSNGDHKEAEIYNHLHEIDKTVNNSENVYNITQGNTESEYSHIPSTKKTRDVSDCEYSHIHGGSAGEDTDTYNHVHKGSAEVDRDTYSHVHKGWAGLDKDV